MEKLDLDYSKSYFTIYFWTGYTLQNLLCENECFDNDECRKNWESFTTSLFCGLKANVIKIYYDLGMASEPLKGLAKMGLADTLLKR